jgi:hypothetical protein
MYKYNHKSLLEVKLIQTLFYISETISTSCSNKMMNFMGGLRVESRGGSKEKGEEGELSV